MKELQETLEIGLLVAGFGTLSAMLLFCLFIGGHGEPAVRRAAIAWCVAALSAATGWLSGFGPLYALAGMVSAVGVVMVGLAATGELDRRNNNEAHTKD